MKAVAVKVLGRVRYTVWRDSVVVHGKGPGRGHKGKKEISVQKSLLPGADPGDLVISVARAGAGKRKAENFRRQSSKLPEADPIRAIWLSSKGVRKI
jgi:hypothetical protein